MNIYLRLGKTLCKNVVRSSDVQDGLQIECDSLKPNFEDMFLSGCFSVPGEEHRKVLLSYGSNQKKTAKQETSYLVHPRRLAQLLSHCTDVETQV